MVSAPRLVVAAPSSGAGKTTVATGLMAALAARGLAVSPHKVGPDYIDPGYHALATGRPGRNLDPWLTSEDLIAPLFLHGARGADVAVVEGVMGLYDGAAGQGELASTAHVAKLLRAPVVLVVDAASAGRSVAATVHGFMTYDSVSADGGLHLAGVVLNRVGSDRHAEICRAAVEELGLPVLGLVRRHADVETPSRHLGLIPAAERRADAVAAVRRLGALIAASCDLDALLALARTAPALPDRPWTPAAVDPADAGARTDGTGSGSGSGGRAAGPVVAVAGGAAFTFGYAENAELLEAAGARVVWFDPLRDEALPEGTAGLVVGGGFPEMYAADLSANEPLRTRIAAFGGPVYAECAGLLYLTKALDGAPMCGMLDATATMTPKLTLGYRAAVAVSDSVVARAGERVRGHEFHRTAVTPAHGGRPAWQWSTGGPEGFVRGHRVASYLHLHWAARPEQAARFVGACA
ncbi:cobyrinate a,c-diamide synthase [Actinomadura scrupuli]|uniref:cobyrinate a,c-diamide synthase n=1 Tax=Actinomadura scrupuli TaxID=559629 RepID=UPI003D9530AC